MRNLFNLCSFKGVINQRIMEENKKEENQDVTKNPLAFPVNMSPGVKEMYQGMSLRDYFAAKAIQGILAGAYSSADVLNSFSTLVRGEGIRFSEEVSERAFIIADAMLKERSK